MHGGSSYPCHVGGSVGTPKSQFPRMRREVHGRRMAIHGLLSLLCRWTVAALAKKFHVRRQRVLAILALKVSEVHP